MKRILLSFLLIVCFATKSLGAEPTFITSAFGFNTNTSTATTGSFTPTGSNRVLIIYGYWKLTSGPFTSVVCNGVTATMYNAASTFPAWVGVFYIINPASVSQTCTFTTGGTEDAIAIAATAWSNGNQTTPIRSATLQSGTGSSFNIDTSSQVDDAVLVGAMFGDLVSGALSGGTVIYSDAQISMAGLTGTLNRNNGASLVNATWSCCNRTWAFMGVSIAPAAAPPSNPVSAVRRRGM